MPYDDYPDVWAEIHSARADEDARQGFATAGAEPSAAAGDWTDGLIGDESETPGEVWRHPRISERLDLQNGRNVYTILCDDGQEEAIKALVVKLNKKLGKWSQVITITGEQEVMQQHWLTRRNGQSAPGAAVGKSPAHDASRAEAGDRQITVRQVQLTIESPAVVGKSAKLIGAFERAEDGVSVYRHALNGATEADLEPFLSRWNDCDHCGFKRDRHASFLCETTDGERVLIGRQCSRDFLGLDAAELLARDAVAKVLSRGGETDEGMGGGGGASFIHVETLVKRAYLVAKRLGGYSRDAGDTFRLHLSALEGAKDFGRSTTYRDLRREYEAWMQKAKPEPLDLEALADYVYAATGDFGENLRIAFGCVYAKPKRRNLIVAGVGLYVGRALKLAAAEAAEAAAPKPPAKLLDGAAGARVSFLGTVERCIPLQSDYGTKTLVVISGDDGAACIHYNSAEVRPQAGERYKITATIKAHGVDRRYGSPQTILTRAVYADPAS